MRGGARHLARDKGFAAPRALVIEHDAVADEYPVGLAIIDRMPMRRDLADRVRAARVERRSFVLGCGCVAEHLGRSRLIIPHGLAAIRDMIADSLEQAERAEHDDVRGVLRDLEGHFHVALRGEIIDFMRPDLLDDPTQRAPVREIAIVKRQLRPGDVRVVVEMIDALGIEQDRPTQHAMHRVSFFKQQLGQIRSVLPRDAGDSGCPRPPRGT